MKMLNKVLVLFFFAFFFSLFFLSSSSSVWAAVGDGFWSASGSQLLDAAGNKVKIAGVNHGGLNQSATISKTRVKRQFQLMKNSGYNTIRLLYSTEAFDLKYKQTSLESLDYMVRTAGEIGLKIILDRHRLTFGGPELELWYNSKYPEGRWIDDWTMLARRYKGNPTIIGADLDNEPHGSACWGCGGGRDWRLGAERVGKAILSVNPDWLIIVEGVEANGGSKPYWWAGNLTGARDFPVRINRKKLVYQAHEYGANLSSGRSPYFNAPNFPNNLPPEWNSAWGYLYRENIAPLLIGEFGTKLSGVKEQQWFNMLMNYMGKGPSGISWTYWSWHWRALGTDDSGLIHQDESLNLAIHNKLVPYQNKLSLTPIGGGTNPPPPPSACQTGPWQSGSCSAGGCVYGQRQQARTVTPSGCAAASKCVADQTCIKKGDADLNGFVDLEDFGIWKENYGKTGDWSKGNFNSDTKVDGLDYVIWFGNYGR